MRAAETIVWPGGEHPFRLGIGELLAIEQSCDAGVFSVMLRLMGQNHKIHDVLAPIRLGLIGGGMTRQEAQETLDRALENTGPYHLTVTAAHIMQTFLMWEKEELPPPGETTAGTETTSPTEPRSKTDEPNGASTSRQARRADSRRKKSTT